MGDAGAVTVLGSANIDLVYTVERIPSPGETVLASRRARHPGGKGLNQAVAAARAGARTVFVGALGDDEEGAVLLATMVDAGIDTGLVRTVSEPTGTASITVQSDGDNTIVVAAGANGTVDRLRSAERTAITDAALLVTQLELPLPVVAEGVALAHESRTSVLLNAAPAQPLDDDLLSMVDVLVVNEHEAHVLTGRADARAAATSLLDLVRAVVVTSGARGAEVLTRGSPALHIAAPPVPVVDTTGAGDTFVGVLASGLAAGVPLPTGSTRAVTAASLSTRSSGAVPSIPTSAQIDDAMRA